jgi:hypothetical protein
MEISGLGGGLMFAAAAGLWLVYLMPTWFKRREYLATERNAVRLQQTLRVLAETSEVPEIVRAETTSHSIAAQERALREQRQRAEAIARSRDAAVQRTLGAQAEAEEAQRALALTEAVNRATTQIPPVTAPPTVTSTPFTPPVVSVQTLAARRLRRSRAAASLVTLAGLVTVIVQLLVLAIGGGAAVSAPVLGFASIAVLVGLAALSRLATVARRRLAPARPVARPERTRVSSAPMASTTRSAAAPAEWTPVPVPKPLYLSRTEVARPTAADVEQELRVAAAAADSRLRATQAAEAAPEVVSIVAAAPEAAPAARGPVAVPQPEAVPTAAAAAPAAPTAAPSRFARMGIVDESDMGGPDLDAVLRRRRQAS